MNNLGLFCTHCGGDRGEREPSDSDGLGCLEDIHHSEETDLDHVNSLLGQVYEPEGVQIWLSNRRSRFNNRSALELITEGRSAEVLGEVRRLVGGAWG